jgi:epoxide hydrolase-like predicted phosphatase
MAEPVLAPPTGLLIDYGGVLTSPVTRSFRAFSEEAGLPRELVKEAFLTAYRGGQADGLVHRLEVGDLSSEAFGHALAADLTVRSGIDLDGTDLVARLFAGVAVSERMLSAVEAIRRAGVRTGLLSNSWGKSGYPRHRFAALFDTTVISAEVGLRKPDPAIYALAADRLGLPPERCVFVDDLDLNVSAAQEVGMVGVVHTEPARTLARLSELFRIAAVDPGD